MHTGTSLRRADRTVATDRPRRNKNAAEQIVSFPELRNIARIVQVKRCLPPEEWSALRWNCYWNQPTESERGGTHA